MKVVRPSALAASVWCCLTAAANAAPGDFATTWYESNASGVETLQGIPCPGGLDASALTCLGPLEPTHTEIERAVIVELDKQIASREAELNVLKATRDLLTAHWPKP